MNKKKFNKNPKNKYFHFAKKKKKLKSKEKKKKNNQNQNQNQNQNLSIRQIDQDNEEHFYDDFSIICLKNFNSKLKEHLIFNSKEENEKIKNESMNWFENEFHLNKPFYQIKFSNEAHKLRVDNAGGSSLQSESLSFEILRRELGVKLVANELEIEYDLEYNKKTTGPKTDYACKIENTIFGVSVTRTQEKYQNGNFSNENASKLFMKKLKSILSSTIHVKYPQFDHQILHIWTSDAKTIPILKEVFSQIEDSLTRNCTVLITLASDESSSLIFK
ncbi:hypothetical protein M0811_13543 [Anaeramoeba ignava]|uniref:Uncharacterized protein n=1 Tax=Anaeramoeba ignava TaxID=1746090 RepID=A0A9Q0L586_ANAIG|nr:hypothetical protein M0811_13543 [Anaeramoeba ignava]